MRDSVHVNQDSINYPNYYAEKSSLQKAWQNKFPAKSIQDIELLESLQQSEIIIVDSENKYLPYFEQLSTTNQTMSLWLDQIEEEFDRLSNRLDTLEAHYAKRAFKARAQTRHLHTVSEMGVHLLDAFKTGERSTGPTGLSVNPDAQEEAADSNAPPSITAKKSTRDKWLSLQQFNELKGDPIKKNAYLGLLYQRLANIKGLEDITPQGLELVSTRLIGSIYKLDSLRTELRAQQDTVDFEDYYPFVRTSVDFLNILLETPIGAQAFNRQHPELKNFSKISDQSLSLFENVFAENYGEAIQNLINLFAYIWNVDIEDEEGKALLARALPSFNKDETSSASLDKKAQEYQKGNQRFRKVLFTYGNFMANIVGAQKTDQVYAALQAAAVPPGSSSVKRTSEFNLSLNSYFGGGIYREVLKNNELPEGRSKATTVGLSVPIGFTATFGGGPLSDWSYSLFLPILDLGVVTSYRLDAQNTAGKSEELPELSFGNLIAPGAYFIVNIPKSPFSIAAGAQLGPQLRKLTVDGKDLTGNAWRYGITATIDVPIFTLFNR